MPPLKDLYTAPAVDVDYALVREFVLSAEAGNLFTESLTFEAKERRNGANVAEAVAALGNTDGGIVLVGVKDKGTAGEARIVGVPAGEHDALVGSLHAYIPEAMPEVIPVAVPDGQRLVLVLRVDADAVPHPVVVSGRVLYRVPGMSVPADRRRVLELAARDSRAAQSEDHGRLRIQQEPYEPLMRRDMWEDGHAQPPWDPAAPRERYPEAAQWVGEVRVRGGLRLPRRALDRPWLSPSARDAAQAALESSPLSQAPGWSLPYFSPVEARVSRLRLRTPLTPLGHLPYRVQAAADILVAGRDLQMAVALRWTAGQPSEEGSVMSLERIYHALIGELITVTITCRRIAQAAGAAEPTDPLTWHCYLRPGIGDLEEINWGLYSEHAVHEIPVAYIPVWDLSELDRLARDWLTYYLLDLDARGFEQHLNALTVPDAFHLADLT